MLLFLAFAASCFMLTGHTQSAASTSTTFADGLQHLQATYKGRVDSQYGVAGGYWQLDVNYSSPTVPTLLAKTRYRASNNKTCWDMARAHPETLSALYRPTRQPPTVTTSLTITPPP